MIPLRARARVLLVSAILAALSAGLGAQASVTAADFFKQVQAKYSTIDDYEAGITITTGKTVMSGTISYKTPGLLRIDFDDPKDQVICYNGEELIIYVPTYSAILRQYVGRGADVPGALGGSIGLELMGKNFTVAYESSPQEVPLDSGSQETVIRLSLTAKLTTEGYRSLLLSIDPQSLLIRRIEGITISNSTFRFDYRGIKLNQGIPEKRFSYESPASANEYNNFLFNPE
jgi:outer membrane lipoprotein-sorting protein